MTRRPAALLFALLLPAASGAAPAPPAGEAPPAGAGVLLREIPLELPTYPVGPPEPHPIFFDGRAYQNAKGPIYPYPLIDRLGTAPAPKTWRALRLENPYVEITVLPEIGGRIFTAVDKTNGYDFFYRQHVIKPALIGMNGAWISGGVEWNVFHHHRVTSFMPVEWTLQENPDGSRTAWIGETELRHRMRWILGLTLRPDSSALEVTLTCFNRTPLAQSFLYFANPAVAVNDQYQVIFPPGTEYATSHTKDQFVEWPVARRAYKGVDYAGVDLSWIRNHPAPNSFFAWNDEDPFIAGYDHGRRAGVLHVADPRVVPGKKLWQWGTGPTGRMWEKILTDADGPYAEIMVGAFSDNQPDYSWIRPGEVKVVKQVWYPIREMGGVKQATVDAAVNLEPAGDGAVRLAFNATAAHRDAKALLLAGGRAVFEKTIAIGPDRPFAAEVPLPAGVAPDQVRAVLATAAGRELVSYTPAKRKGAPMPEPYRPPPPPRDIRTNEELYLAGSRLEQFYNPYREPDPYYEEALRRDPGDVRVNTALGLLLLKRGMAAEAEARFREAVKRTTANHTKARDGAPQYYLGVALRAQGRDAEADAPLAASAWDQAFAVPAGVALAELACRRGDWSDALECLRRVLAENTRHTRAIALTAAVLRRNGHYADAAQIAAGALAIDPLDAFAGNERALARAWAKDPDAAKEAEALARRMRGDPQAHLELSCDYAAAGMWDEALEVLARLIPGDRNAAVDPMILYHAGYCAVRKGDAERAARVYRVAASLPWEGCFPSRLESADALRAAMKANPRDARAHLYLGNLLYDHQPAKAVAEWEAAVAIDPALAPAHRNLGFAFVRRGEAGKAVAAYEAALAANRNDPLVLLELDQALDLAGAPPERRLKPLEENRDTVLRKDRTIARLARLLVILGRHDEALDLLASHHFHLWEGEAGMYGLYAEARIRRGEAHLAAGRAAEAQKEFEAALAVPPTIEVWSEFTENHPRIHFLLGRARQAAGDEASAKALLEKAAASRGGNAMGYYGGRALQALGRADEAKAVFEGLVEAGRRRLADEEAKEEGEHFELRMARRRRMAEAQVTGALGLLGLGRPDEAKAGLKRALELDNSHTGAWCVLRQDLDRPAPSGK